MKHDVLVSGRSAATVLAVGLAVAVTTAKESRADAISDLLDGKKISVSVRCQNQVNQGGVWVVSLNSRGNLIFQERGKSKPVEIVNGKARVSLGYGAFTPYSATVSGNELTVSSSAESSFGAGRDNCPFVSSTTTIRVSGNSCSATHTVCNGGALEIDETCRAVSCAVASAPAVLSGGASSTTLVRDVDCNQKFPGETGLGLYLKGKYRATCTVDRSYHDRDDATKKKTIRVTACARSDSQMEVQPLARMRARDYAFSLALKSLPHPEMDSGGDKDIGCGK